MLRAGLIKKQGSGIYTYMPMGLRIIRKVEHIIRTAMNEAGAIECSMPVVQPAELWQETGRLDKFGEELLRFKDRHNNDFVLQPTSEEVVTSLVRADIKSHKQLPVNLYQIQTKFRDERRPRFGIMRGREFMMKDAYSFDKDEAGMRASYEKMFKAYHAIFTQLGLTYRAVDADTGSIGGVGSCEFHVIAQTGEDAIAYSTHEQSKFAANIEATPAPCLLSEYLPAEITQTLQKIATPNITSCEDVAKFLNVDIKNMVKSLVVVANASVYLVLIRGDHSLNEVKLKKALCTLTETADFRWATAEEIQQAFKCKAGYLGPVNIDANIKLIIDSTVAHMHNFVCGANNEGYHYIGCNWGVDLPKPDNHCINDIRNAVEGDASPDGLGALSICRGIEVGHVFMLGTKYSEAMQACFMDTDGKNKPMVMGCYGIGVTRILGAAIEQNNDDFGIIWPQSIAPFQLVLCPISYDKSELVKNTTNALYDAFIAKRVDVILDDRGERAGSMFADWDLIGIPHRIVIGEKNLAENEIEYQARKDRVAKKIKLDNIVDFMLEALI